MAYHACTLGDMITGRYATFLVFNGIPDYKAIKRWFGDVSGYDVFKAAKMATATQLTILGDAKQTRVLTKAGFYLTFN